MHVLGLKTPDHQTLHQRWDNLSARVGVIDTKDQLALTFEMINTLYSTPPRAYHNLSHINACLHIFDQTRNLADNPDAVEAALWLHHAVYFPEKFDNEEHSAFVARSVLGLLGTPPAFVQQVEHFITATQHEGQPEKGDAALTADIDIAVLGAEPDEYDRYRDAIHEEFAFAEEDLFQRGRLAFIERQLDKQRIFWTPFFHNELEHRARNNLERERTELERELRP